MGTKAWLILAAVLVAAGVLVFGGAILKFGFSAEALSFGKSVTNTYMVEDAFDRISVETDTADVVFVLSEDDTCRVVAQERENVRHDVSVDAGTLRIKTVDERKWYEHIGFFFGKTEVTVYLPERAYASLAVLAHTGKVTVPEGFVFGDMDVTTTTGSVVSHANVTGNMNVCVRTGHMSVGNAQASNVLLSGTTGKIFVEDVAAAENFQLKASTGDITVNGATCKNLTASATTGDIRLTDVFAQEAFSAGTKTGDVILDNCDGAEMMLSATTGDVRGTVASEKVFSAKASTGRVHVPEGVSGGRCTVSTTTGDIELSIAAE